MMWNGDGSWGWWWLALPLMIMCIIMMGRMMGHGHRHRQGSHETHGGRTAGDGSAPSASLPSVWHAARSTSPSTNAGWRYFNQPRRWTERTGVCATSDDRRVATHSVSVRRVHPDRHPGP